MTDVLLRHLEVTNFRSIKGTIHAPLDAKVVLVHGENGAGKTSLLSAIELALTGRVISLQRADPQYMSQLLYRSAVQDVANQGAIRQRAWPAKTAFKALSPKPVRRSVRHYRAAARRSSVSDAILLGILRYRGALHRDSDQQ
jgi:recombinational DNA repair ATPase RecF